MKSIHFDLRRFFSKDFPFALDSNLIQSAKRKTKLTSGTELVRVSYEVREKHKE